MTPVPLGSAAGKLLLSRLLALSITSVAVGRSTSVAAESRRDGRQATTRIFRAACRRILREYTMSNAERYVESARDASEARQRLNDVKYGGHRDFL